MKGQRIARQGGQGESLMGIERHVTIYEGPGGPFEGMAVVDNRLTGAVPGVLLIPNVLGTKEADFIRAEAIAGLGYAVLVGDVYGRGKRTTRAEGPQMGRYMAELNDDRALLKARLTASLDALKVMPQVDTARCAAIGYCFGGKCVLDIARHDLGVKGVVSFHGVYDRPPVPVTPITAKILVCHGWDDPICPPDAMVALGGELTEAGADWQIHAYGNTSHAFTDASMNAAEHGIGFQPDADRRSWKAMTDFLGECLA
jgi:dienelactone hydrolase